MLIVYFMCQESDKAITVLRVDYEYCWWRERGATKFTHYSKPFTPNLCGYSVVGLSSIDDFREHSLVAFRIPKGR